MILGNAGIVTVIISSTSSFVTTKGYSLPLNFFILVAGIFIIYKIATLKKFIMNWERFIENKLVKYTAFEEDAVEDLLHLIEGYGLVRAIITEDSSLIGDTISKCESCGEKMVVLGIERDKKWIPIPGDHEKIENGDRIVAYGKLDELKDLFK